MWETSRSIIAISYLLKCVYILSEENKYQVYVTFSPIVACACTSKWIQALRAARYLSCTFHICAFLTQVRSLTSDMTRYRSLEYIALCFYDFYAGDMPISSLFLIENKSAYSYSSITTIRKFSERIWLASLHRHSRSDSRDYVEEVRFLSANSKGLLPTRYPELHPSLVATR